MTGQPLTKRPLKKNINQKGRRLESFWSKESEKGIEKVAKSLLSLGIPIEQIGIATGLPSERIEALR